MFANPAPPRNCAAELHCWFLFFTRAAVLLLDLEFTREGFQNSMCEGGENKNDTLTSPESVPADWPRQLEQRAAECWEFFSFSLSRRKFIDCKVSLLCLCTPVPLTSDPCPLFFTLKDKRIQGFFSTCAAASGYCSVPPPAFRPGHLTEIICHS